MSYSKELANAVTDFLDQKDWYYKFDEENGLLECGVNLNGKMQSCRYVIIIRESSITTLAICPLNCQKEYRDEMAKFLTMANYNLRDGNFEMDFSDGEIRYKCYVPCGSQIPEEKVIATCFMIPSIMFEKYGDAIVAVLFGFASAQTAYEQIKDSK